MDEHSPVEERLREKGLRVTLPRVAVLEFLNSTPSHPTAEEVGAAVNRRDPTVSRASIYNVLHSLAEAGLIEEMVFDDAVVRYDSNLSRHHHFVCKGCGKVDDVKWESFPITPRKSLPDGRRVESCAVVMRGLCTDCRG